MQNMTIDNRQSLSSLMTAFAAFHPAQIAFLAWMFSFFLHIWVWPAWQTTALKTEPATLSQRIEVMLMSEESKQPMPIIQAKTELPAPKVIENIKPKAIPIHGLLR